jgi:FeS assembly protein IscX
MAPKFGWTDVEEIVDALRQQYPDTDPMTLRFPQLTGMVEQLDDFQPPPGQVVNERILETIQAMWIEEDAEDED